MTCPNCGVNLIKGSKYCPRCGILFESNDVKEANERYNSDFLEIYFPNKKLRFHIDRISLLFLLFSYFYAVYKKMYKEAIFTFLSQIFLLKVITFVSKLGYFSGFLFLPIVACFMIYFSIYFYYVFHFDSLLIDNRKMKINKILKENEGKEKEEIIEIIENDSKGNIIGLIIFIVICLITFKLLF